MEAEKIISVTGRGNIHVVPDVTRVEVKINSILRSYKRLTKSKKY